jgi:asparagine synthetase B (glutamine-hydrolysing)
MVIVLTSPRDRCEMAHFIERKPAFLDHQLTEYVDYLPPSAKNGSVDAGEIVENSILREATRPSITASSTSGPKTHIPRRSSAERVQGPGSTACCHGASPMTTSSNSGA